MNNNNINQSNNSFQNNNINQMNNSFQNNQMNNNFQSNPINNGFQNNSTNFNPNNNMMNQQNKPKMDIKKTAIIVGVILLIVLLLLLFKCGNNNKSSNTDNNTNNNNTVNNNTNTGNNETNTNTNTETNNNTDNNIWVSEDLAKNISINKVRDSRGNDILFIKNNNNVTLNIGYTITYYDANDKQIIRQIDENTSVSDKKIAHNFVEPGDEIVDDSFSGNYPGYDHYKIEFTTAREVSVSNNRNKNIQIVSKDIVQKGNSKNIQLSLKNNYSKSVSSLVKILYYKNGQLLGMGNQNFYSQESGTTETKQIITISDKNGNEIDFDDYKIYIEASSY